MEMVKKISSLKFFDQIVALEQEYFGQDALTFEQLSEIVLRQDNALFMYCENDQVLGYIYVQFLPLDHLANVMKLTVKSDSQREGIAGELISYMEQWCQANEISTILLEARMSNTAAIHLYRKLGYRVITVRKNFYQFPQEDGLVFEKQFLRSKI